MTPELTAALERATKEAWPEGNRHFLHFEGDDYFHMHPNAYHPPEWLIESKCSVLDVIAATAEAHWRRRAEAYGGLALHKKPSENKAERDEMIKSREMYMLWAAVSRWLIEAERIHT